MMVESIDAFVAKFAMQTAGNDIFSAKATVPRLYFFFAPVNNRKGIERYSAPPGDATDQVAKGSDHQANDGDRRRGDAGDNEKV